MREYLVVFVALLVSLLAGDRGGGASTIDEILRHQAAFLTALVAEYVRSFTWTATHCAGR
jgi:hypothetical protein